MSLKHADHSNYSLFFFFFGRSWELIAPWMESKVEVSAKFIVGDLDLTYNTPGFNEYMCKTREIPISGIRA